MNVNLAPWQRQTRQHCAVNRRKKKERTPQHKPTSSQPKVNQPTSEGSSSIRLVISDKRQTIKPIAPLRDKQESFYLKQHTKKL